MLCTGYSDVAPKPLAETHAHTAIDIGGAASAEIDDDSSDGDDDVVVVVQEVESPPNPQDWVRGLSSKMPSKSAPLTSLPPDALLVGGGELPGTRARPKAINPVQAAARAAVLKRDATPKSNTLAKKTKPSRASKAPRVPKLSVKSVKAQGGEV